MSDPDPAKWKIIGGFDPSQVAATNVAANWTDAIGNFTITTYSGLAGFTTNGLKTIQIYATDDAGAVGNVLTLKFTLNATNLPPLPPTSAAGYALAPDAAVG